MRLIRNCARARWLPSRHRYALAKLIALIASHRTRADEPHLHVYAVDRDQSTFEQMTAATWIFLTSCAYGMAVTPWWSWPLVILVVPLLLQLPFYFAGAVVLPLVMKSEDHRDLNTYFQWIVMIVLSAWAAASQHWSRFVAWFFFGVLALNAIAAVIVWMFRGAMAKLERECGLSS